MLPKTSDFLSSKGKLLLNFKRKKRQEVNIFFRSVGLGNTETLVKFDIFHQNFAFSWPKYFLFLTRYFCNFLR